MRHIVALSGGKDSAALALFLHEKHPRPPNEDYELAFADTGRELPDLYRFLDDISRYLGKEIHRLTDYGRDFDYYLKRWNYFLPGNASRWCTKHLKLRPFERFVGEKENGRFKRDATIYIGLRADEMDREGNYGIEGVDYKYPFQEDGIDIDGVMEILRCSGLKLPDFYQWRSTGGCWMCPWQRASDWKGLEQHHPELLQQAIEEEIEAGRTSGSLSCTWSVSRMSIKGMIAQEEMFPIERSIDSRPCLICAK